MSEEMSRELNRFCQDFHINSAEDLQSVYSILEQVMLFGLPLADGGYIGITDDGLCKVCNSEVFKEPPPQPPGPLNDSASKTSFTKAESG